MSTYLTFLVLSAGFLSVAGQKFQGCGKGLGQCGGGTKFEFKGKQKPCTSIKNEKSPDEFCLQYQSALKNCRCHCDFLTKCGKPTPKPTRKPTRKPTPKPTKRPTGAPTKPPVTAPPDPIDDDFVPPPPSDVCFSADSTLNTDRGTITMAELRKLNPGTVLVKTITQQNEESWSPVRIWIHAEEDTTSEFMKVQTDSNKTLTLSPTHLIYTVPCTRSNQRTVKLARDVRIGQCVLVDHGSSFHAEKIISLSKVQKAGLYAFSTTTGSVLVNDIACSAYAVLPYENVSHWFFTFLYHLQQILPTWMLSYDGEALHPFAQASLHVAGSYLHA